MRLFLAMAMLAFPAIAGAPDTSIRPELRPAADNVEAVLASLRPQLRTHVPSKDAPSAILAASSIARGGPDATENSTVRRQPAGLCGITGAVGEPIGRVAGWDTPYPHAFEWQYFPGKKRVVSGIRKMMEEG